MENKGIMVVPQFMADAVSSLEKMQSYAQLLASSELLPKHFYMLDAYKKPIRDKDGKMVGNIPAIIMTIQHGIEIGMSVSSAIQQIIPINGVMSIKGDGAMALIQNSGLCVSWVETESGSIEKEDYEVTIKAKRSNGIERTVTFSVEDAKRLGLWITKEMLSKNENLRHGSWWKVPKRMIRYRALGFISRDLFPEVIHGMYTEEEARDFTPITEIKTSDGLDINISDKGVGNRLIDNLTKVLQEDLPVTSQETFPKVLPKHKEQAKEDEKEAPAFEEKDIAELKKMKGADLLAYASMEIGYDIDLAHYAQHKEKRTKANIIGLIEAYRAGVIGEYIASNIENTEKRDIEATEALKERLINKGIVSSDIEAYIAEKGLQYSGVDDFLEMCTEDEIQSLEQYRSDENV